MKLPAGSTVSVAWSCKEWSAKRSPGRVRRVVCEAASVRPAGHPWDGSVSMALQNWTFQRGSGSGPSPHTRGILWPRGRVSQVTGRPSRVRFALTSISGSQTTVRGISDPSARC